jgi:hypothetical protein
MNQLENSNETHKVYLEVFDMYPHFLLWIRQRDIRIIPMCAATVTH